MFAFEERIDPSIIENIASAQGISKIRAALTRMSPRSATSYWTRPKEIGDGVERYPLISISGENVVYEYASALAASVQFPTSSAYMHFLGCVSASMLNKFFVEYHGGEQPTCLYVVTSQPPSSGKSAINGSATAPMLTEVDLANEKRKAQRKDVQRQIREIDRELKNNPKLDNTTKAEMYNKKEDLEEKLLKMCDHRFCLTDSTPEALAQLNARQGHFAVISDEATAINAILGQVYGNGMNKANNEVVLKGWDMNQMSIGRKTDDSNVSTIALGAISVIAQDETIESIMTSGQRGNGVSERFLLVREEPLLGTRVFCDEEGNELYQAPDGRLKKEYYQLVHNIMTTENKILLSLSKRARQVLNLAKQEREQDLGAAGKYSHSLLRGYIGKMDKQVIRIASVLHTIKNWAGERPLRAKEIDEDTLREAIAIFDEVSKTYLSSASAAGYAGDEAEMKSIIDHFSKEGRKTKNGTISRRHLIECSRKYGPLKGQQDVAGKVSRLLDELEAMGHCVAYEDRIVLNPIYTGI